MQGKELFAAVNSGFNALSFILLITAFIFIKKRNYYAHGATMICALITSAMFLTSYLISKALYGERSTGMPAGAFRTFYFIVLFPHLLLAVINLPLIFMTVKYAVQRRWEKHRKLAKWALGIWLYVSVTGVLIYFILYRWYPALYPDAFNEWKLLSQQNLPVNSIVEPRR